MPIDNCPHDFEEITQTILPKLLSELQDSIRKPLSTKDFIGFRSATREALKRFRRSADFPGCYVFIDAGKPIYVGISRGVVKRLVQHINFDSHYSASLVYRISCSEHQHTMRRDEAMKHEKFLEVFATVKARLRQMEFAYVEVQNDLVLYLFEVYAAMKLDTHQWNTFRTH